MKIKYCEVCQKVVYTDKSPIFSKISTCSSCEGWYPLDDRKLALLFGQALIEKVKGLTSPEVEEAIKTLRKEREISPELLYRRMTI